MKKGMIYVSLLMGAILLAGPVQARKDKYADLEEGTMVVPELGAQQETMNNARQQCKAEANNLFKKSEDGQPTGTAPLQAGEPVGTLRLDYKTWMHGCMEKQMEDQDTSRY